MIGSLNSKRTAKHVLSLGIFLTAIRMSKVATYQLLANNDIASVPHYLLSTVINPMINTSMLEKLFKQHKSLVVKPLQGSRGNLVAKFGDRAGALKFIKNSQEISWVASPYIDIKRELRLVIFNGSIWLAYEKLDPKIIGNLKMFNVNLGAHVRNLEIGKLDRKIKVLAKRSMDAIGLKLGAVDIILDDKENAYVLEINSGFSLEHYAQISPANRHNVLEFYKAVISSLFVT